MRTFSKWALASVVTVSLAGGTAMAQTGGGQTAGSGQTGGTTSGGQSGSGGQTGGGQSGDMGPGSSQSSRSQGDPQKFVEKAAINNMAEIQLGQLAQQKAQDPEVKQFAQMMVDQHTKAQDQLQQAASAAGLSIPSSLDSKHQKIQDKLSNLSGAEFDRQYMKVMVDSHKDTQKLLEQRAGKSSGGRDQYGTSAGTGTSGSGAGAATGTSGTSGATGGTAGTTASGTAGEQSGSAVGTSGAGSAMTIDSWAQTTLPEVQQHLQQAKDLEKRVKDEGKNSDKNDKDKSGR